MNKLQKEGGASELRLYSHNAGDIIDFAQNVVRDPTVVSERASHEVD